MQWILSFLAQYRMDTPFNIDHTGSIPRNACVACETAMRDYQESVTTRQTDGQTDRQTPDKVIPMCGYALQATQSKIEKVPRGIRGEKSSKDMASSRN